MSDRTSADWKKIKAIVKEAYENGTTEISELSMLYNVKAGTIRNWMRKEDWKTSAAAVADIEEQIKKNMNFALNEGLKQYIESPADTSLQSLVVLIKDYMKRTQPSKELNIYVLRFLDQTSDYYIQKGDEIALEKYQENVVELAEYLRLANNG